MYIQIFFIGTTCRLKDNIKIDLKEMDFKNVNWIELA